MINPVVIYILGMLGFMFGYIAWYWKYESVDFEDLVTVAICGAIVWPFTLILVAGALIFSWLKALRGF